MDLLFLAWLLSGRDRIHHDGGHAVASWVCLLILLAGTVAISPPFGILLMVLIVAVWKHR